MHSANFGIKGTKYNVPGGIGVFPIKWYYCVPISGGVFCSIFELNRWVRFVLSIYNIIVGPKTNVFFPSAEVVEILNGRSIFGCLVW